MNALTPLPSLNLEGNVAGNWKDFIASYRIYATATGVDSKEEKIQCATFLHVAGPQAQKVFQTMTIADANKDKITHLINRFEQHCELKQNVTFSRYKFNSRYQKEGETFDKFLTDLKNMVRGEFGILEKSLLKDRIVVGVREERLREKLLQTPDLDLDTATNQCRVYEMSMIQMKSFSQGLSVSNSAASSDSKDESVVHRSNPSSYHGNRKKRQFPSKKYDEPRAQSGPTVPPSECFSCGYRHGREKPCPAKGQTCRKCGKMNHFKKKCKSRNESAFTPRKKIHEVEYDENFCGDYESGLFVDAVHMDSVQSDWLEKININGSDVVFKLDTGAQTDIIPTHVFKSLHSPEHCLVYTKMFDVFLVTFWCSLGHTKK